MVFEERYSISTFASFHEVRLRMETCRVDSEVLQSVYENLAPELRGSQEQNVALQRLWLDINPHVKNCADNVKLTIYMNDINIVIYAGKGENEIVITIEDNGNLTIFYCQKTWSKYFNDGWDKMKQIIFETFSSIIG